MAKAGEAIISIRPNYAKAILLGSKTVELRRRIPSLAIDSKFWIYETRPTSALVGTAVVQEIFRGEPDSIWEACSDKACVTRLEFDQYFDGAHEAIGIVIGSVEQIVPIHIETLRGWRPGFHPPQVILKLTGREATSLCKLVANMTKIKPPKSSLRITRKSHALELVQD